MRRIHPSPVVDGSSSNGIVDGSSTNGIADELSTDDLVDAYAVPELPPSGTHVRANLVASVDGAATLHGSSRGLGTPADRRLLGLLRDLCDVVLVGAGTARAERYGALRPAPARQARRSALGLRPAPRLAVVSSTLDLDPDSPLLSARPRTILLTHGAAPPDRLRALAGSAEIVVAGECAADPAVAVRELAARGLPRVLCEGGPELLGAMAAAKALDELCLTVSPLLVAGAAGRIMRGDLPGPAGLGLRHVLEEDGALFLRYAVAGAP